MKTNPNPNTNTNIVNTKRNITNIHINTSERKNTNEVVVEVLTPHHLHLRPQPRPRHPCQHQFLSRCPIQKTIQSVLYRNLINNAHWLMMTLVLLLFLRSPTSSLSFTPPLSISLSTIRYTDISLSLVFHDV